MHLHDLKGEATRIIKKQHQGTACQYFLGFSLSKQPMAVARSHLEDSTDAITASAAMHSSSHLYPQKST